jgi:sterol desaturase/sphingolipid hydroxylase (fatty acid hydroxylase superfamily)
MGLFAFTEEFEETVRRWNGQIGAPSLENRQKNRIRVYKNGFVEHVLASSHPILPGVWFGGFIAYGGYLAAVGPHGPALGLSVYGAGILGFTLIEYLLHRFLFHYLPDDSYKSKVRLFMMHGIHHEFPNDKWRLVAPPLMSWPIAIVLFALYWALLPHDLAWILFGGTTLGYLCYDWIHYATHHFRSPKTRLMKILRRAHAVHHYKLFQLNMGISSPLWDLVFGTFAWSEETVRAAMAETRKVEEQSERALLAE